MGTDVSGIARTLLHAKANGGIKAATEELEQDMTVNFMDLLNQSSLPNNLDVSTDSSEVDFSIDTDNSTKTAYDTCAKPMKSVSVKEEASPEEVQSEMAEPLEMYEEEVRDILKEELGVTDEEISMAMESLGMSFLDVRNLQSLSTLIQTLTGEDVGTLFLSDSFQTIMEQMTILTEELCAELGITKEELNALCETWKQAEALSAEPVTTEELPTEQSIVDTEETEVEANVLKSDSEQSQKTEDVQIGTVETIEEVENQLQEVSDEPAETVATDGKVSIEQTASDNKETEMVTEAEDTEVVVTQEKATQTTAESNEETEMIEMPATDKQENSTGSFEEQTFSEQQQNSKADATDTGMNLTGQQNIRTEEFVIPQESARLHANPVDTVELIQQIARQVRVTISATTTSMEMQLNPENLGKIYLNISERDGVIRAQIATQTETVKEALETQLVELRQSLSQQGIKVDAIEITVATHEFEQNLEGNAKQEEQTQRQMEESEKQTRRNLNLNELDELSGLMTEEEQLVAQIMRDNGNQVDLTA